MTAYYNEYDPGPAAWLRELIQEGLIPNGEIDERDIRDVAPADLRGFVQCHFFAGVSGWAYALRLAGWPDERPVWTGSCPCQPWSSAGKRDGANDDRHLWPAFRWLIQQCWPDVVFGEQVASSEVIGTKQEAAFALAVQSGDYAKANKIANRLVKSNSLHYFPRWADGVRSDMETLDYAFLPIVLGAHSVGAPHIRQRLWWVGYAEEQNGRVSVLKRRPQQARAEFRRASETRGLADGNDAGSQGRPGDELRERAGECASWAGVPCRWHWCRDGKWRRIPVEPALFPLAHGLPGRVGILRGAGNAIVSELAAAFVQAAEGAIA